MGQETSGDQVHLFEQPVQQDETIAQKQQQRSQIPMGQGVLMELQQQIQQPNLQMQLMEQMSVCHRGNTKCDEMKASHRQPMKAGAWKKGGKLVGWSGLVCMGGSTMVSII